MILRAASSDALVESPPRKPRKGRKAKSSPPENTAPADTAAAKPTPTVKKTIQKSKPKAKAKAKAASSSSSRARAKPTEPVASAESAPPPVATVEAPVPKAKAKAKAKAKSRSLRTSADALAESPFRSNKLIKELMEWVGQFGPEFDPPEQLEKYKAAIREHNVVLLQTALNIYWSRCTCGVRVNGKVDTHHFTFNTHLASPRLKTSMAVRCAELAVSWLNPCYYPC